jgi:hypothetical protein
MNMIRLEDFKPGSKIVALPMPPEDIRGYFPNHDQLSPGRAYTVAKVDTGSTYTSIALEELPGLVFNSCSFTREEE